MYERGERQDLETRDATLSILIIIILIIIINDNNNRNNN